MNHELLHPVTLEHGGIKVTLHPPPTSDDHTVQQKPTPDQWREFLRAVILALLAIWFPSSKHHFLGNLDELRAEDGCKKPPR